jgi:hypothetical protein
VTAWPFFLLVTLTEEPKGSDLCAAVMALSLRGMALAVLVPGCDESPTAYTDATHSSARTGMLSKQSTSAAIISLTTRIAAPMDGAARSGPSTTCSRRSRPKASSRRRRASSPREELAPIAEVNVTSLKEYDFFTYAKANGTKQAEFYRQFSGLIRASKASGSAAWSLFGLSFFYGIFHAAGPGHGKAVISSYLVANEETWRRGVVLSFASALIQALVAVAVVGVAAALLNATAATMKNAVNVIETVSYALIIVKFRDCVGSERGRPRPLPPSHLKSPRWEYCRVASATNCCVS